MRMYLVTVILRVDDVFEQRKPDAEMVKRYVNERIRKGVVAEQVFRGAIIMNVMDTEINVKEIEF